MAPQPSAPVALRKNDIVDQMEHELATFGHRIDSVTHQLNSLIDRIDGASAVPMKSQQADAPPPSNLMARISQLSETILHLEQAMGRAGSSL
jgi:uncharacterized coiled-coil protein SlyX